MFRPYFRPSSCTTFTKFWKRILLYNVYVRIKMRSNFLKVSFRLRKPGLTDSCCKKKENYVKYFVKNIYRQEYSFYSCPQLHIVMLLYVVLLIRDIWLTYEACSLVLIQDFITSKKSEKLWKKLTVLQSVRRVDVANYTKVCIPSCINSQRDV
jgi:hypothetical protein